MEFIVQYNMMHEEQLQKLKRAVKPFPHKYVGVIPFSREINSDEPLKGIDFIPYGSTLLSILASDLKWKGLHFDLSKFNYGEALANRDDMLNDNLDTLENHLEALASQDCDMELFVRPSEDLKIFSGQVMRVEEMYHWLRDRLECDSSGSYKLDKETMIIIDQKKNIQAEWRWFVIGGKIVDGSLYRARGQLIKKHEEDSAVIKEAQTFADKWLPDENCVMDLALCDNELKVIEFNCINSSGFYDNDVDKIFHAWWKYFG